MSNRTEQIREYCGAAKQMNRAPAFERSELTAEQVKDRLLSELRTDADRREYLSELARREYRRRPLTSGQASVDVITEEDYVQSALVTEGLDTLPFPKAS